MCTALKGPNLTWMLILLFFFDMDAYSFVGFIITCIKFERRLFQKREETRLKMVQRPALVSQKHMSFWAIIDLVNTY